MKRKLIIDGNAVYEMDDECICRNEAGQITDTQTEKFSHIMTDASGRRVSQSINEKGKDGDMKERDKKIRICQNG